MTDISTHYRLLSGDTLLDIAANAKRSRLCASYARTELIRRVEIGDIDDIDCERFESLGLV